MLFRHCPAIIKISLCYQHTFHLKYKTQPHRKKEETLKKFNFNPSQNQHTSSVESRDVSPLLVNAVTLVSPRDPVPSATADFQIHVSLSRPAKSFRLSSTIKTPQINRAGSLLTRVWRSNAAQPATSLGSTWQNSGNFAKDFVAVIAFSSWRVLKADTAVPARPPWSLPSGDSCPDRSDRFAPQRWQLWIHKFKSYTEQAYRSCRRNCTAKLLLISEVLFFIAQCFHRFSWRLPSVLKKSKLSMSLLGRGRSRWSGQGVLWAMSWCCFPGLGGPRMPGTCELSELWPCWHCKSRLSRCLGMPVQTKGGDKACRECDRFFFPLLLFLLDTKLQLFVLKIV